MPEWLIALLASLGGAAVGGLASAFGAVWMQARAERRQTARHTRTKILTSLGDLQPSYVRLFQGSPTPASFRVLLDHRLPDLAASAASTGRRDQAACAALARAWRDAVPKVPNEADNVELTSDQEEKIDKAARAVREQLGRRLPVFDWKWLPLSSPKWPDPL